MSSRSSRSRGQEQEQEQQQVQEQGQGAGAGAGAGTGGAGAGQVREHGPRSRESSEAQIENLFIDIILCIGIVYIYYYIDTIHNNIFFVLIFLIIGIYRGRAMHPNALPRFVTSSATYSQTCS